MPLDAAYVLPMFTAMSRGKTAAIAGRRIDGAGAETHRFPSSAVARVRAELLQIFAVERVECVVSAAACGIDLLALDAASTLGLRRRIVLPFARTRFRETSVIDRGVEWGEPFDRTLDEVEAHGDLVTLTLPESDAGYLAANAHILDEAAALGNPMAVVGWEGVRRSPDDVTAAFLDEARKRGWLVREIATIDR